MAMDWFGTQHRPSDGKINYFQTFSSKLMLTISYREQYCLCYRNFERKCLLRYVRNACL